MVHIYMKDREVRGNSATLCVSLPRELREWAWETKQNPSQILQNALIEIRENGITSQERIKQLEENIQKMQYKIQELINLK